MARKKNLNKKFEYQVETSKVGDAEYIMNDMAEDGWRVVAVTPDIFKGYGVTITFERAVDDDFDDEE